MVWFMLIKVKIKLCFHKNYSMFHVKAGISFEKMDCSLNQDFHINHINIAQSNKWLFSLCGFLHIFHFNLFLLWIWFSFSRQYRIFNLPFSFLELADTFSFGTGLIFFCSPSKSLLWSLSSEQKSQRLLRNK